MTKYAGINFSVPSKGSFRVHGHYHTSAGPTDVDYTVEAETETEALQKVFGVDAYIDQHHHVNEDNEYLAFLRET